MPTPVWTFALSPPLRARWEYTEIEVPVAPGFEKYVFSEIAHSAATGHGTVASRRGRVVFEGILKAESYTSAQFKAILAFLHARKAANNEAFYYYNWPERTTPDETGADTTGRYLVVASGDYEYTTQIGGATATPGLFDISLTFKEVFE